MCLQLMFGDGLGNTLEEIFCGCVGQGGESEELWAVSVEFCPGILAVGGGKRTLRAVRIAWIWDELFHRQIKQT